MNVSIDKCNWISIPFNGDGLFLRSFARKKFSGIEQIGNILTDLGIHPELIIQSHLVCFREELVVKEVGEQRFVHRLFNFLLTIILRIGVISDFLPIIGNLFPVKVRRQLSMVAYKNEPIAQLERNNGLSQVCLAGFIYYHSVKMNGIFVPHNRVHTDSNTCSQNNVFFPIDLSLKKVCVKVAGFTLEPIQKEGDILRRYIGDDLSVVNDVMMLFPEILSPLRCFICERIYKCVKLFFGGAPAAIAYYRHIVL